MDLWVFLLESVVCSSSAISGFISERCLRHSVGFGRLRLCRYFGEIVLDLVFERDDVRSDGLLD
jgi:hypothetical protein